MPRRKATPAIGYNECELWIDHERLVFSRARHWAPAVGESYDDLVSTAKAHFFQDWVHRFNPSRAKMSTYLYRVTTNLFNRMRQKRRETCSIEDVPMLEAPPSKRAFMREFESCSPATLTILAFIFEYYDDIFTKPVHARRRLGILRDHLLAVDYTEAELNVAFREIKKVLRHVR